jgi:CubicO group peptidase (beta-lactamase class C family)
MSLKNAKIVFRNKWVKIIAALLLSFLMVLSISSISPRKNVEKDIPVERFSAYLDEKIPYLMANYKIPGVSIAILKEGKTVWMNAYGYASIEEKREMTTDTYLRVQSISKPVTAWGVMRLIEQGKIGLDQPINQYIKEWQFPESSFSLGNVTVRQLLSHTSGLALGDFFNFYAPDKEVPSLRESLYKEVRIIQETGSAFFYSNVGFNLLELLIEEATGLDFAEYMEKKVLLPLGMKHSSFVWSNTFEPPVPNGYDLHGKVIPVYVYPEKASGGLFATVEDIATFLRAGMKDFSNNHQVLNPESIDLLYEPMVEDLGMYSLVFDGYGLGHYIEDLSGDKKAVSHGGQGTGWMTHFHSVPETGDGIVILTNSQRSWPFIASILSDWAKWNGFSPIGMERILLGQYLLWAIIGIIWFLVILQILFIGEGLALRRRQFRPFSKQSLFLRLVQFVISIALVSILLWSINQDYLFISSIFPIASVWLGISLFASAVILLLCAFFPARSEDLMSKTYKK